VTEEIRFAKQIGLMFIERLWSGMGKGMTTCYQENIYGLVGIGALVEATSLAGTTEVAGG